MSQVEGTFEFEAIVRAKVVVRGLLAASTTTTLMLAETRTIAVTCIHWCCSSRLTVLFVGTTVLLTQVMRPLVNRALRLSVGTIVTSPMSGVRTRPPTIANGPNVTVVIGRTASGLSSVTGPTVSVPSVTGTIAIMAAAVTTTMTIASRTLVTQAGRFRHGGRIAAQMSRPLDCYRRFLHACVLHP